MGFDHVDARIRRHARLHKAVVPTRQMLDQFAPDEDGRIEEISKQEAIDRGLIYYASSRLGQLDKVYQGKDRMLYVIRDVRTGLSLGDEELLFSLALSRQTDYIDFQNLQDLQTIGGEA